MIYRSNLTAPDLTESFKHLHVRPMGHSFGHSVPSDWADKRDDDLMFGLYKKCGMFTHDEAAILYNIAAQDAGQWIDIGAHTGWTTAHLARAGCDVGAIDPMLRVQSFAIRFGQNMAQFWDQLMFSTYETAEQYFHSLDPMERFHGFVIDGDHEPGKPEQDAANAVKHLHKDGVIVLHDFMGQPVRNAVRNLLRVHGMVCRVYLTPHCMAVCWWPNKGGREFVPPFHIPDLSIVMEDLPARWSEYDWRKWL